MGASSQSRAVVKDYLRLPDRRQSGCGMTAGGSLSPLLAAVMLIPLDEAMNRLFRRYGLFYVRDMDDLLIMAQKRHQLRRAIKRVHEVLQRLGLRLHGSKRLIGKLSKGFDFLGYRVVPGRRLRSSAESKRSREDSQETTSSDRSSVSMAASVCSAPHRWTPSASSFFPSSTDEAARLLTV